MSTEGAQVVIRDNPDEHRYELVVDGGVLGEIQYHRRASSDRIALLHTEISPSLEGQGLASRLIAGALEDIRSRRLHVVPICPFVRTYLRRHHEYEDLVVPDRKVPH